MFLFATWQVRAGLQRERGDAVARSAFTDAEHDQLDLFAERGFRLEEDFPVAGGSTAGAASPGTDNQEGGPA